MAYPSDDTPVYKNLNTCRSFNVTATTTQTALTGMVCSEVFIMNKSGQDLKIWDNGYDDASNAFLIEDNESMTIRGVTNASDIKVATSSGTGAIYYRTQFFSSNPSR